jgi:hypothetical protein
MMLAMMQQNGTLGTMVTLLLLGRQCCAATPAGH